MKLEEGSFPTTDKHKTKVFKVTSNGEYIFRAKYKDGTEMDTTVNVNNYLHIKGNPARWTAGNVELELDASGGIPTKVRRIRLPDNKWVNGDIGTYGVVDNGTYQFIAEDLNSRTITKEVVVNKIDRYDPTISITQAETKWTKDPVDLEVIAYDAESGIEKVAMEGTTPEGLNFGENLFQNSNFIYGLNNWVHEGLEVFEAENNTITIKNKSGATVTHKTRLIYSVLNFPRGREYTVSFDARKDGNPDKLWVGQNSANFRDIMKSVEVDNEWKRYSVTFTSVNENTVSFTMEDTYNKYQMRNVKLEEGDTATPWIPSPLDGVGSGSSTYQVFANGDYEFTASDYANNTAVAKHTVTNIDREAPEVEFTKSTNNWLDKGNKTITAKAKDDQSGFKRMTLPDGRVTTNETATYIVNKNGKYVFTVEDVVGNIDTREITISQFDTTPPEATITGNPENYTDKNEIILTVNATDTQSGVESIQLPNKQVINSNKATYKVTDNGEYQFIITDKVGNKTTKTVTVDKLMIEYFFHIHDSKGQPLRGAEFMLIRDGEGYATATSDESGLVHFGKVPPTGKYTIRQTKAPDGHIVDPEEKDVDVDDESDPIEIINYPRGEELPATGTNDSVILVGTVVTVGMVVISMGNKKKRYRNTI